MSKLNLIIQHFKYLAHKQSNAKNYYQGIEVTKQLIELTKKVNINQDELDKIIQLIEDESIPNTPWYDLWLEVKNLGKRQNLNIPPHNPWYEGLGQTRCISESVYSLGLTYGNIYTILNIDDTKQNIRVINDQKRHKWYPQYCFTSLDDTNITHILSWSSEDLLENSTENPQLIEVDLKLSNGTERWCFFSTPEHLASCGNIFGVEQIRWHEPMAHLIVTTKITKALVNHVLKSLEAQGEIISSTLD